MSESRGIYDTVDFFATLNATTVQRRNNELSVFVDKNRNGECYQAFKVDVDFDTMTIKEKV